MWIFDNLTKKDLPGPQSYCPSWTLQRHLLSLVPSPTLPWASCPLRHSSGDQVLYEPPGEAQTSLQHHTPNKATKSRPSRTHLESLTCLIPRSLLNAFPQEMVCFLAWGSPSSGNNAVINTKKNWVFLWEFKHSPPDQREGLGGKRWGWNYLKTFIMGKLA